MIYVTHDQVEAMTLADQIVVMNKGRIEQVGAPKMNLLRGSAIGRNNVPTAGIRPEHIRADTEHGDCPATLQVVETLGADTILYAKAERIGDVTVRLPGHMRLSAGERLFLTPYSDNLHLFDVDGQRMRAA